MRFPPIPAFFRFAGLVAAGSLLVTTAGLAQSASFAVERNGKPVGTASFTLEKNAVGYDSSSMVHVSMQGMEYQLSKSEKLGMGFQLQHAQVSAIVNGSAVHVVAKPDPAQFLLNISANGRSSTTRLDAHNWAVFLPDFDPGALETLLRLAESANNRDLWAILPKQQGSIVAVKLATYPDEQGTLGGQAVVVHHLVATFGGEQTDLFSGPQNELLQAELPQAGFALVRDGFTLTPPKHPMGPPAPPAGEPNAGQAPGNLPNQNPQQQNPQNQQQPQAQEQ